MKAKNVYFGYSTKLGNDHDNYFVSRLVFITETSNVV